MKRAVVGWALAAILGAAGAANADVILRSFPGINLNNTIVLGRGFIPPDMGGAVGDQYIAQFVNGAFAVYSRTGAL
jgi:hypothetical protein